MESVTIPDRSLPPLQAYLLGGLAFDDLMALQRRLVYEATDSHPSAAAIVCEHPQGLTIGRHGSRDHIRITDAELAARRWPVNYVARGGGVVLHVPGQVACYPVLPLERLGVTPAAYVRSMAEIVVELLAGFGFAAEADFKALTIRVHNRRIAHLGMAVRHNVTAYGVVVNVAVDLESFCRVWCDGDPEPMTSLQRECQKPVRVEAVRQRLPELLAAKFGFPRVSVFHSHPSLQPRIVRHAITDARR